MKELPKINQLRDFLAIIKYGNIKFASHALFKTQPALTRSIQELERILGVTLLARGSQGITLTDMGRAFEPRANTILNDLERAVDELHQLSEQSQGNIVFGCSHLPAFSVIPSLINKFQESNPKANITIIEGQLCELITSLRLGRLDFFVGIETPEISMNEFTIQNSFNTEFCIVVKKGHPLSHRRSLKELRNAKWFFPSTRTGYFKDLECFIFGECSQERGAIIYGESMTIGEQLVLNEDYLFIAPKVLLEVSYIKELITTIPIKESLPKAQYILIFKKNQGLTPLAKELLDRIDQECFELLS